MGRLLKRVPLDFEWEIGKIWSGYINPHNLHKCQHCEGLGFSKEYKELENEWYGWENENWKPNPFREGSRYNQNAWNNNLTDEDVKALLKRDRLYDFTRIPLTEDHKDIVKKKIANGGNSWLPFNNGYIPTAKEVNEWNLKGMGHDSINCGIVIEARLKREKKPYDCPKCNSSGENWQHKRAKELYEGWEGYDLPKGEGYQLWENTSEGSPKSPVFKTLDDLCEWCESNTTTFASHKATKQQWFEMLSEDNVYHKEGNAIFL